ncbi:MAG: hypothetical protein LBR41_02375, partial [Rickettsiales bacterium]|nr:hypothetical protein [Rickettsiales bacterium]
MGKKLNTKIQKQINRIDTQIETITNNYEIKRLEIEDRFPDATQSSFIDEWNDSDWEMGCHIEEIYADYDYNMQKLTAKKNALLLIGYHIARRGKKLHQS